MPEWNGGKDGRPQSPQSLDFAEFLANLDIFYLGTANAEGQPYIQHRSVPLGSFRVLDEHALAFGDLGGNRQYIPQGMVDRNPIPQR